MKSICFIFFLLSVLIEFCEARTDFKVTYISSDHVYIDGGKVDGLSVGDKLKLSKHKDQTVVLEIVFVSEHSACCTILDKTVVPVAGDGVSIVSFANAKSSETKSTESKVHATPPSGTEISENRVAAPVRVSGNAAILLYQWFDQSEANLDFMQSSARLNLTAANIFRENLTFAVKTRGRYDFRTKAYDGGISKTSWENRLWELSLTYYDANSVLSYSLGRILPRRLGGIGYIDGLMAEFRTSRTTSFGLFAGRQPEWLYSDNTKSITKVGLYGQYQTDKSSKVYFSEALGFVEELYGSEINRSFVASSGNIKFSHPWGFSHNAEMDINTGWRKDRAVYTFTLSNLNLHSYYQVSSKVRTSINYDKRKHYWTYQYRSLPDSLFDSRINQGLKTMMEYSPIKNLWLSGSLGFRKHDQTTDATISYSSSARYARIFNKGLSVSAYVSGFEGPIEHGTNLRVGFDIDASNFGSLSLGFSNYLYSVDGQNSTRSSRSVELGVFKDVSQNYYLGSNLHYDTGDDINGLRLQLEFGVRY